MIAGIDTLEIGFCIREYKLSDKEWSELSIAKESAQSTLYDKGTGIKFRGKDFMVLRTGSGRYKFILTNEDLDIRIFMDARSGLYFPELKIRFKSKFLWRHGWKYAVDVTDRWIRSWAIMDDVKISRIDIMVDILGDLHVLSAELLEVVTRARNKKEFGTHERYSQGRNPSGYRFGGGELMCRIYDKTVEIYRSDKRWFERLWRKKGWVKGEGVTRIEFQCRHKIIRQMGIRTLDDLYRVLPDLWKYLTDEWLTVRVIQDDSHRTRWPISVFWQTVQGVVPYFGEIVGIDRISQMRSKGDLVERNARGYLLNLAALASKSLAGADVEYGINYIRYFVGKILDEPELEQEIEKRRHKYDIMEY